MNWESALIETTIINEAEESEKFCGIYPPNKLEAP